MPMVTTAIVSVNSLQVKTLLFNTFTSQIHAKRLSSLSDSILGALTSHSLQPSKIGDGLAEAKGLFPKHARKQVDRLISNDGINDELCQNRLARLLISNRKRIMVAMDWTVFAKDGHMTITLRLVTTHGRATPLLWKTVSVIDLKGNKNKHVFALLEKLRMIVSENIEVILLADREFGTLNQMKKIKEVLGFEYILRLKRNFTITDKCSIKKLAYEWLNKGAAICIEDAKITVQNYPVKKVIICQEAGMKEMWCLACSFSNIATQTILKLYGKRWTTETSYRDEKDLYFGMGLKKARIKQVSRRDRLLLISAFIIIFLTLLGAASEAAGFDKYLKSNTSPKRTHSLFTQGRLVLRLLKKLPPTWIESIGWFFIQYCQAFKFIEKEQFVV
jgi:hypothetical protein